MSPHFAEDTRPKPCVWCHPVDELEPLPDTASAYRRAAQALLPVFDAIFEFLKTSGSVRAANLQWAYALGLPTVRGHSPTDLASRLGVSEAEFSAGVQRFLTRIPSAWADRPPVPSDKRRRHEGLRLGILKSSNRFYRPSPQARLANLSVARRGSP